MASVPDMDNDLEAAWAELHAANDSLAWFVGRPAFDSHRLVPWAQYAFDPKETPKVGRRSREWTATAHTELECVREMARCLREIGEGRVPRSDEPTPQPLAAVILYVTSAP
jgi:hypothetical protein